MNRDLGQLYVFDFPETLTVGTRSSSRLAARLAYPRCTCETQGTLVASTIASPTESRPGFYAAAGDAKIDDTPVFTALAKLVGTWAVALGAF